MKSIAMKFAFVVLPWSSDAAKWLTFPVLYYISTTISLFLSIEIYKQPNIFIKNSGEENICISFLSWISTCHRVNTTKCCCIFSVISTMHCRIPDLHTSTLDLYFLERAALGSECEVLWTVFSPSTDLCWLFLMTTPIFYSFRCSHNRNCWNPLLQRSKVMVTIYIHNLQIIHKGSNRYARTDSLL